MSRVLVTGAAGFVGANLVRALQASGNEVSVFLRRESKTWRLADLIPKLKVYPVDISDKEAVQKAVAEIQPEVVYHLATYGGYPSQKDIAVTFNTNLLGSLNLFQALESADSLKKLVNIGSSSEYGIKSEPMSEDKSCFPMSFYGISKLCMTLFCRLQGLMSSLPVCTLRLFSPYGYCDDKNRLIPQVITSALLGRDIVISNPDNKRDYIFIDDVVNAYLKVISKKKFKGNIINIGSGKEYSVKNITEIILKLTGSKSKLKFKKSESKITESPAWMADITKAKEILEWEPAIDITPGLKKTID